MRRRVVVVVVVAAIVAGVAIASYLAYHQQANRVPYALEIDAIRDVADVGIQYRIRMSNVVAHSS
jgi:hypothetical protein